MMPQKEMRSCFLVPVLVFLVAVVGAKCAFGAEAGSGGGSSGAPSAPSSGATIRDDDYRIQVDDVLTIDGHRHLELSGVREYVVGKDGTIKLIYIGRVQAAGLTKRELEEKLEKLYDPKYFKNLVITVEVRSKTYDIGGEVNQQGIKQLMFKTTLLKAILSANGFTDFADQGNVIVYRRTAEGSTQHKIDCKDILKGKAPDDFLIQADDLIWVPRKGLF
jgi:protein involved in polysaccharide export with SLBB domain